MMSNVSGLGLVTRVDLKTDPEDKNALIFQRGLWTYKVVHKNPTYEFTISLNKNSISSSYSEGEFTCERDCIDAMNKHIEDMLIIDEIKHLYGQLHSVA